jgi:hypothetical protein
MRNRILVPLVVLVLALAAAGTAAAATGVFESNDSGLDSARDIAERGTGVTQPTTSTPDTTMPGGTVAGDDRAEDTSFVNLADGASQTFAAGQACSVTVQRSGGALTVLSVDTAAGFASEVEQAAGVEVEVQCSDGTSRVDFDAELEDGVVRVRVRVRAPEAPAATAPEGTVPPATPTTAPDRVDNSGPGNAHDAFDDDRSGPGSGGDNAGDDHSGSGSGDDDSGFDDSGFDDSGFDDSGHGGSGPG